MAASSVAEVDVKYEDQIKINEFSKLYQKKAELSAELPKLEEAVKKLEDSLSELEMTIEDEIDYQFAECFVTVSVDSAREITEKRLKELRAELREKSDRRSAMTKRISELKRQLYEKFGNNINLDE